MRRVVVVADTDSRWKWGAALGHRIGGTVEGVLLTGRATPNARQLRDTGVTADALSEAPLVDAVEACASADVVVLACVGGTVQAAMHALAALDLARRPVVVTGYVGVVYERVVDGLLLRAGADVVVAGSAHDERVFRGILREAGADEDAVVRARLPFLGGAPYAPDPSRPFTVCFATQPSSPPLRHERVYLLRRAIDHAKRHPDRRVVVKLRSRPDEQTTHVEDYHYEQLAKPLGELPPNLEFRYGTMEDTLAETDLLVTISSTAAVESAARGIPTAILTDVGVREVLGNHWFLGSGAMASWDELDDAALPRFDPVWAQDRGVTEPADGDGFDELRAAVDLLTTVDLPPLDPWYSARRSAGYLPRMLERAGLPVGSGYSGSGYSVSDDVVAFTDKVRRRARHATRRCARRVYRVGVRRVEPAIRRWAQI